MAAAAVQELDAQLKKVAKETGEAWGGRQLTPLEAEDRLAVACEKAPTDDPVLAALRTTFQVPPLPTPAAAPRRVECSPVLCSCPLVLLSSRHVAPYGALHAYGGGVGHRSGNFIRSARNVALIWLVRYQVVCPRRSGLSWHRLHARR